MKLMLPRSATDLYVNMNQQLLPGGFQWENLQMFETFLIFFA